MKRFISQATQQIGSGETTFDMGSNPKQLSLNGQVMFGTINVLLDDHIVRTYNAGDGDIDTNLGLVSGRLTIKTSTVNAGYSITVMEVYQ